MPIQKSVTTAPPSFDIVPSMRRFFAVIAVCVLSGGVLPVAAGKENYQQAAPLQITREAEKWADKTLHHLSLEEKIGQLLMVRAEAEFENVSNPDYLRLRDEIQRYHLGGLLMTVRTDGPFVLKNQPLEAANFTNRLQQESKLPLIFAADFERGLSMRLNGVTVFPHAMAFGAAGNPSLVEGFAQIVAQESRAIGVQWNFFPIADVNSNPANPIINTRAFGGVPTEVARERIFGQEQAQVGDMVAAYIHAARDAGMMTTAKHFPGHGDTQTDSHLQLARVTGDLQHLKSVELPPFQRAIDAGVDAVMVAHVTAPALESDEKRVASDSPAIIQNLLQQQMGFKGIVVPDAMDMNAFTRLFVAPGQGNDPAGRAAVEAIKAGEDMVLLPTNLDAAYNALVAAVRGGEISEARIDVSVRKLLVAKAMLGLHRARLVDLEALPKIIATPEHLAFGQMVADSAVTLVRDNGAVLPLRRSLPGTAASGLAYQVQQKAGTRTVAIVFSDDVRSEAGRLLERELKARIPDADVIYVDPRIASALTQPVLAAADAAQSVMVAVYLVPTAGRVAEVEGTMQNILSMDDPSAELLRQVLARAARKTVVVALGSPYIATGFPQIETYMCTFSNTTVSELSAVKALFGEIPIRGHLPVSVPNIAARGSGLQKPATAGAPVLAPAAPTSGGPVTNAK